MRQMTNKKIIVLGAGISGLATAYWLMKDGFDVHILRSQKRTRRRNGNNHKRWIHN
ncbi:MAG: FAD-dependent oxidoreductase [Melioribacteraceae bacterium]|nr:FAD-dependent oxidoreductase [Melioribacteraceae bacterium]